MSKLTPLELEQLTLMLSTTIEELEAQYALGQSATNTVVLDQSKVGRLSRMDAMQQQKMAESSIKSTENRLRKVKAALSRVTEEGFGDCEECALPIAFARLKVQPEAQFCIQCQALQEH